MNDVIPERIEIIKNYDVRENKFELRDTAIKEEYNINRSFHRGSSTTLKIKISQSWQLKLRINGERLSMQK